MLMEHLEQHQPAAYFMRVSSYSTSLLSYGHYGTKKQLYLIVFNCLKLVAIYKRLCIITLLT